MDLQIPGSVEITYDGKQYEVEYLYYSISPDEFEIHNISSLSGEPVDSELYEQIRYYCQLQVFEDIRAELVMRNENFMKGAL